MTRNAFWTRGIYTGDGGLDPVFGELVDLEWSLFVNRDDLLAVQKKTRPKEWYIEPTSITKRDVALQLLGAQRLGAFAISDSNTSRWICYDFDDGQGALSSLLRLRDHLEDTYGASTLLEASGTPGHYHVFSFWPPDSPSSWAYHFGRKVLEESKLEVKVEVFPKQCEVSLDHPGGIVGMPLGVNWKTRVVTRLLNRSGDTPLDLEETLAALQDIIQVNMPDPGPCEEPRCPCKQDRTTRTPTATSGVPAMKPKTSPPWAGACGSIDWLVETALHSDPEIWGLFKAREVVDRSLGDYLIAKHLVEEGITEPEKITAALLQTPWTKIHEGGWRYWGFTLRNIYLDSLRDRYIPNHIKRKIESGLLKLSAGEPEGTL